MKLLEGVRILDLGGFIAGPLTSALLAEWGADVIKVERPGIGDPFRRFERKKGVVDPANLYAPQFRSHNRNKRSIALDITSDEGLEIFRSLVATVDVLVINSRPGVPERLGIGYQALKAINERLVFCEITGFGSDGPYADRPAFDNVGQAVSGWSSRYRVGDDPRVLGPAIADPMASYNSAIGILAALYDRQRTGQGRLIEVNLLEPLIALAVEPIMHYLNTGMGADVYYRAAMSQAYTVTCSDGLRIGLHPGAVDKFWESMSDAIGRSDLPVTYPTRAARIEHYQSIAEQLNEVFLTRSRDEWLDILSTGDVPYAPERGVEDIMTDPQVEHLGTFYETEHPRFGKIVGPHRPVLADGSREIDFRPPPALGEHTAEVLTELGILDERIVELARLGIINDDSGSGG
ncbi:MAG: CoA transferase [Subtercola sp.]|nr:CoA transferase [Subtercola sp.]